MSEIFQSVVVYDSPKDHKGFFIARRWETNLKTSELKACEILICTKNYDDIYDQLSDLGLNKLTRSEKDDPCIKEVWI